MSTSCATPYLQALVDCIPEEYKSATHNLIKPNSTSFLVDSILRLVTNSPCPSTANSQTRATWSQNQSSFHSALQTIIDRSPVSSQATSMKRKRTPSPPPASKKPRLPDVLRPDTAPGLSSMEDCPLCTLHAISVTSPVRKKVDITLGMRTLRLTHPITGAVEASFPVASLARAFVLPTRGKFKPHWTVILMSHDNPPRPARSKSNTSPDHFQLIFGLDATCTSAMTVTRYEGPANEAEICKDPYPPKSLTRGAIDALLNRLPTSCPVFEPNPDAFRSNSKEQGIAAYRGAKEGTLWFLKQGLLGESKPCEFWTLDDLKGGEAQGGEAVRLLSATGRTCSVFVTRKAAKEGKDTSVDSEQEEEEGDETEFSMVDGREQDNIREWVRKHRHLFGGRAQGGKDKGGTNGDPSSSNAQGKKADEEEGDDVLRDSDDEDSDFEVSSSDGGSPSSESEDSGSDDNQGSGDEGGDEDEGEGSESGSARSADDDAGSDDEEEMDPRHHPLMRPGAMPRMSRAAMDAAVGMVVNDLIGGGGGRPKRTVEVDVDEEEEDELDE